MKKALLILLMVAPLTRAGDPAPQGQEIPRIGKPEQVEVSLVLIDLVVRDRKDRPVSGLTLADFELLVDRLPVDPSDIESFEEICPAASEAPPSLSASPNAARPPQAEAAAPPPDGPPLALRHIVLYFDFSQMTLGGRRQSLMAARDHVASRVTASDRIMILAYKDGLRLVQDFTSDHAALVARLDEMIADPLTLDIEVVEENQKMRDVASKACEPVGPCTTRKSVATAYAAQEEMRARKSLRTIEGLMPALAGLKGRKAFILFTDTLRDEPGIEYIALARTTPQEVGVALSADMLRLTQEANAAGVSFYTVHASGLDDRTVESYRDTRTERINVSDSPDDPGLVSDTYLAARSGLDSALALQSTIAAETGGRALQRSNDLAAIIDTAQQDLSCYYLLGYRHQRRGDNQRHSLIVRLKPGADGESRRGLSVRHRPYYYDTSAADRADRLVRSALDAPELYQALPVAAEAFDLAPEKSLRRVLIKATLPLDSLALLPRGTGSTAAGGPEMEARARVQGEVTPRAGGDAACVFQRDLDLKVPAGAAAASRVIFETGCVLKPGLYDLVVMVMDSATQEVRARRSYLNLQVDKKEEENVLGGFHLWARDRNAILVTAGAERIGMKDTTGGQGFVPLSERRLAKNQEALLSFMLCPRDGGPAADPSRPITVHRTLQGEADAVVAGFRDLTISEPPDEATGCYQIFNAIPPDTLGDGLYTFTIQAQGAPLAGTLTRQVELLVE